MIKENQRVLNYVHILSDGLVLFFSFPAGFWFRFYVLSGIISVPLRVGTVSNMYDIVETLTAAQSVIRP